MLGAIIGDICGSVFEWVNCKSRNPDAIELMESNCGYTDDSVLTIAVAENLLRGRGYAESFKDWGRKYPNAGYGGTFWNWLQSDSSEPYNSWGNGSAMRVSPIGWAYETLDETLVEAKRSADVTHNHPEGVKGAQAVAAAIFLARNSKTKQEIKEYIESTFHYDLNRTTDQIRPGYSFDVSCQGSVPEAILCFLESRNFEHAIKLAISIGGDSDTIACITGGIAQAFYRKIPKSMIDFARDKLTDEMNRVVSIFCDHYRVEKNDTESSVTADRAEATAIVPAVDKAILSRTQGCLLGQCVGDALGQMVEFDSPQVILAKYPQGVRDMANGGAWNTLAGQPTDDTEMALMLARSIVKEQCFDAEKVFEAYRYWYDSMPFDCGHTVARSMVGSPNRESQANGSLMRISPLGVYGSRFKLDKVARWAMKDSSLTHPNEVCQKSVAIYVTTIAEAIQSGLCNSALYQNALLRAQEDLYYEPSVYKCLQRAGDSLPLEFYGRKSGWVLVALQNAFYHLANTPDLEKAIIETVNAGGDTDTNGAICGALLGAVYGIESIPVRWRTTVLNCRPSNDNPDAVHPRPECFWATDILNLAGHLLNV
jgi:ADP-ribosylglycohydrolase